VHAFHHLGEFIATYGYWAIALAMLLEHAGVPVPAESTLLLASFLAYSEHRLHLGWIIVVGTCAGAIGGGVGYALGYHGGRPLLERFQNFFHIPPTALARGESLIERYGAFTIFFARFIFGLRIIVGPLAGVLRMRWRPFFFYNLLGSAAWVTLIAGAGYLFGRHWGRLVHVMARANLVILIAAVALILYFFWSRRRSRDAETKRG
jgi:membrane protein DedA with SNARE-associated domain